MRTLKFDFQIGEVLLVGEIEYKAFVHDTTRTPTYNQKGVTIKIKNETLKFLLIEDEIKREIGEEAQKMGLNFIQNYGHENWKNKIEDAILSYGILEDA